MAYFWDVMNGRDPCLIPFWHLLRHTKLTFSRVLFHVWAGLRTLTSPWLMAWSWRHKRPRTSSGPRPPHRFSSAPWPCWTPPWWCGSCWPGCRRCSPAWAAPRTPTSSASRPEAGDTSRSTCCHVTTSSLTCLQSSRLWPYVRMCSCINRILGEAQEGWSL